MTPAARNELNRLEDAPPSEAATIRMLKKHAASLRAELSAAQQRINQMQTDIELLTQELARARRACEAAGVEVL